MAEYGSNSKHQVNHSMQAIGPNNLQLQHQDYVHPGHIISLFL